MATRYIHRGAALPPIQAGLPNANSIRVDSDTELLTFGTGASGTTEKIAVDETSTQTLTNKTLTSPTLTTPSLGAATATSVTSTGAILQTGAAATSGYGTGAGGAVTQITSASTGVTLSKPTGQITTVALTTAAAAEERFTVTNTLVAATDVIALATTYNGAGTPMLGVVNVAAGAFDIVITNVHAANALNALMVINFVVIKGVAA